METVKKPATSLPWAVNGYDVYSGDKNVVYANDWSGVPNFKRVLADVEYVTHAANAYPELVAALMAMREEMDYAHNHGTATSLLRKLGELK